MPTKTKLVALATVLAAMLPLSACGGDPTSAGGTGGGDSSTITVGSAILAETGLSFFGFGVQPPDVSLGSLIAAGTDSALTYPWLFLFSAGFLITAVLSVNLVGDGLRDALDAGSGQRAGRR